MFLSRVRPPWRLIVCVLAVVAALLRASAPDVDESAPNRSAALCASLASRNMTCSPEDVVWLAGPSGLFGAFLREGKALVRAHAGAEPTDLHLVVVRLSPEGVLLDVGPSYDLTRTSQVDEGLPLVRGHRVAYSTSLDGTVNAIHTLDLDAGDTTYEDFTRVQRWQSELTNLQQTGQLRGVVHEAFVLDPPARDVSLAWLDDGTLEARAEGRRIVVDVVRGVALEGSGWVRAVPDERARPGNLVTWSVDRVRAMSWFGDTRMQWLKAIVFTSLDAVLRLRSRLVDTSAKDVERDLGGVNGATPVAPEQADPETGWPPPQIVPLLSPTLPGEGQWISLDKDPFITRVPGVHAPFVTTFVRTDKERRDTRVYVTEWDPREIALHMEAGTVEPVSATGEAGPGLIPRTPEIMKRLVAGFNGGFQAMHGEYGMQADGILYLPPKPYAATVMELRDGTTAFGAWPPSSTVPDEVLSFRQNLTALVQKVPEGAIKVNPWGRVWWGGTPPGWQDNIHTTRSGLCLTESHFVAYFYGNDIAADALGAGMLAARCVFGMHLDMNPGLAGFELYDVEPDTTWKPLGRPLQSDWEYEGTLKDLPDLHVRARRMTRSMVEVNFPQYIHREARDFFYLTARSLLPGPDLDPVLSPAEAGEGSFRVKGLPQYGFPYAVATATLRPEPRRPDLRLRILRVDPRTVVPAASAGTTIETPTVVSFFGAPRDGLGVWLADRVFVTGSVPPSAGAVRVSGGFPLGSKGAPSEARAAVGVADEDGFLAWVELPPEAAADDTTGKAMDEVLRKMGCSIRLLVGAEGKAVLGSGQDLSGAMTPLPAAISTRLVRGHGPAAEPYFEGTPIVSPGVWQPLQSQRVRYFPKPPKPDAGAVGTGTPAGSSTAPLPPAPSPPSTNVPSPSQKPGGRSKPPSP